MHGLLVTRIHLIIQLALTAFYTCEESHIYHLCCGQISIGTMLHLLLDLTRTRIDIIFTSSLSMQGMGLKMN